MTTVTTSPAPEVSSTTVQQPLLPPCRVCGEKASGFHYGANTCEACKGFFRRSLHRKQQYQCSGRGNCDIGPGKRNSCAKCRYIKCLSVGMSKEAIKTGRYTHEKRTRDIQEIKSLQKKETVKKEQELAMSRSQELEQMVNRIVQVHLQQTPLTEEFYEKLPVRQAKFLERKRLEEETFGQMKPIPREEYREFYEKTGIDVDGRRELIVSMIPYIEEGIQRFIRLAKAVPGFKELPVDDQIALLKTNKFDVSFLLKFRLFNISGKVFTTPDGIHLSIQDMQKLEYYENIENMCNKAVRLQEQLLSLDEILVLASIALLFTGSRFEVWLLTMYRCFDIENSLFTAAGGLYSGGTVHMDDICKCYDTEFIESMFNRAGQLQNYNLDESEINTLKAVILLFRDRCALQCPDKVEHYQAIMVEALQELLKKNHPKDPLLFPRLLVFLMDLRSLTELHAKNIEKVHLEFNDIQFPPLLYEML